LLSREIPESHRINVSADRIDSLNTQGNEVSAECFSSKFAQPSMLHDHMHKNTSVVVLLSNASLKCGNFLIDLVKSHQAGAALIPVAINYERNKERNFEFPDEMFFSTTLQKVYKSLDLHTQFMGAKVTAEQIEAALRALMTRIVVFLNPAASSMELASVSLKIAEHLRGSQVAACPSPVAGVRAMKSTEAAT